MTASTGPQQTPSSFQFQPESGEYQQPPAPEKSDLDNAIGAMEVLNLQSQDPRGNPPPYEPQTPVVTSTGAEYGIQHPPQTSVAHAQPVAQYFNPQTQNNYTPQAVSSELPYQVTNAGMTPMQHQQQAFTQPPRAATAMGTSQQADYTHTGGALQQPQPVYTQAQARPPVGTPAGVPHQPISSQQPQSPVIRPPLQAHFPAQPYGAQQPPSNAATPYAPTHAPHGTAVRPQQPAFTQQPYGVAPQPSTQPTYAASQSPYPQQPQPLGSQHPHIPIQAPYSQQPQYPAPSQYGQQFQYAPAHSQYGMPQPQYPVAQPQLPPQPASGPINVAALRSRKSVQQPKKVTSVVNQQQIKERREAAHLTEVSSIIDTQIKTLDSKLQEREYANTLPLSKMYLDLLASCQQLLWQQPQISAASNSTEIVDKHKYNLTVEFLALIYQRQQGLPLCDFVNHLSALLVSITALPQTKAKLLIMLAMQQVLHNATNQKTSPLIQQQNYLLNIVSQGLDTARKKVSTDGLLTGADESI
ncbi:hypothetical protein D5018_21035, partial [Parashewanella curva]